MNILQKIKSLNLPEMTLFITDVAKQCGIDDIDANVIRDWLLTEIEDNGQC